MLIRPADLNWNWRLSFSLLFITRLAGGACRLRTSFSVRLSLRKRLISCHLGNEETAYDAGRDVLRNFPPASPATTRLKCDFDLWRQFPLHGADTHLLGQRFRGLNKGLRSR